MSGSTEKPGTLADRRDSERRILQVLCQEFPATRLRHAAKRLLGEYKWTESTHQVVFRCLMDLPSNTAVALVERLSGCATRRGFPDLAWEEYFQPLTVSAGEAEKLMKQLGASASDDHGGVKA